MLIICLVAMTCAALACAGPVSPTWETRKVPLSMVDSHRALCPIVIEKDVDEDRIPQRIKVIKCKEPGGPTGAGEVRARHQHGRCSALTEGVRVWRCSELFDSVLVYYRSSAEVRRLDVSVGCSCLEWVAHHALNTDDYIPH